MMEMKVFRNILTIGLFAWAFILPFPVHSSPLSSLTFHLYQLSNRTDIDETEIIEFTPDQEIELWSKVLKDNSLDLHQAYEDFLEAQNTNDQSLYQRAFQTLSDRWNSEKQNYISKNEVKTTYNDFETNPYISSSARELIRPYLMPADHPMRANMDNIFTRARVTLNEKSFSKAGFTILYNQPRSMILVGRHLLLQNYLIKANLDITCEEKLNEPAWKWLVYRCIGAEKIRNVINDNNLEYCVVPNKYLYPLPLEPSPPKSKKYDRKIVVLLVDDMHIVDSKTNLLYWKTIITPEYLNELYTVISQANGRSYRADNIPFTVDRKIAFVDTEYPTAQPDYNHIKKYLSDDMRLYWEEIVANGGS